MEISLLIFIIYVIYICMLAILLCDINSYLFSMLSYFKIKFGKKYHLLYWTSLIISNLAIASRNKQSSLVQANKESTFNLKIINKHQIVVFTKYKGEGNKKRIRGLRMST
jgi:hypothetical protein